MRVTRWVVVFLLVCFAGGPTVAHVQRTPNYEFRGGLWFDGQGFRPATMYSVGGVLRRTKPRQVDRQFDLDGKFVIPPLAEAHNHWLEPQRIDEYIENYLRDGVFYVKDEANTPFIVSQFRDKVNRPTSVDFITSMQGFTGKGGHPIQIFLQFQQMGIFPADWSERDFDGKALMIVETAEDVAARWQQLLDGKPDFVKAFLLFSENHGTKNHSPGHPYGRGLDPALLPDIVRRAHKAGLSISVHISSATDFHNALAAGADEIAHLPLVDVGSGMAMDQFVISEADARLAARRGVRVITTLGWLAVLKTESPQTAEDVQTRVVIPNLRRLKRHGVKILVGSDQFRQTVLPEILLISRLGVFSNAELLRMACETTPRAMFPNRRIGRLRDGYAASFLVLERNPIKDLDGLTSITLRVKEGVLLK